MYRSFWSCCFKLLNNNEAIIFSVVKKLRHIKNFEKFYVTGDEIKQIKTRNIYIYKYIFLCMSIHLIF